MLIAYIQAVIDDDWPALANDRLGRRTSAIKKQFTEAVLNLEPVTSNQKRLWSFIVADIDALSDHRVI